MNISSAYRYGEFSYERQNAVIGDGVTAVTVLPGFYVKREEVCGRRNPVNQRLKKVEQLEHDFNHYCLFKNYVTFRHHRRAHTSVLLPANTVRYEH
jgi:hypothetical protein